MNCRQTLLFIALHFGIISIGVGVLMKKLLAQREFELMSENHIIIKFLLSNDTKKLNTEFIITINGI